MSVNIGGYQCIDVTVIDSTTMTTKLPALDSPVSFDDNLIPTLSDSSLLTFVIVNNSETGIKTR